jgi:hypothetical protein
MAFIDPKTCPDKFAPNIGGDSGAAKILGRPLVSDAKASVVSMYLF